MPDIREILQALSPEDKQLWTQHRTEMRRSYLTAHNTVMGIGAWTATDDMVTDYFDIVLATLFDRAGRLEQSKDIIGIEEKKDIENKIEASKLNMNGKGSSAKLVEVWAK